jgi:hypothetical protein
MMSSRIEEMCPEENLFGPHLSAIEHKLGKSLVQKTSVATGSRNRFFSQLTDCYVYINASFVL